jgi:dCMP deaminase
MDTARLFSQRSTCPRLSVGAVLSKRGRILSTGYNGNVSGMPHCVHKTDEPCETAVHAEENVLYFAAHHGIATRGTDLFVTHNPCFRCARGLINAGVFRVFYLFEYRDLSGVELMVDAGLEVWQDEGDNYVMKHG